MHALRFVKTEAIVLKHFPLGEADRVVTLYTPVAGTVRAVARGVRRVKSRLGGHLEPLTRVRVLVRQGRTLDVISQAETLDAHAAVRQDLWLATCGLYAAELVDRFGAEGLENRALYQALREALGALAGGTDPDLVLRYFEVRLLGACGFAPELGRCVGCAGEVAPGAHFFSPASGGLLCPSCRGQEPLARPLSLNALKVLRLCSRGSVSTVAQVRLGEELARELEHLLRQYLVHVLERELRSTAFLDMLRREGRAGLPAAVRPA